MSAASELVWTSTEALAPGMQPGHELLSNGGGYSAVRLGSTLTPGPMVVATVILRK